MIGCPQSPPPTPFSSAHAQTDPGGEGAGRGAPRGLGGPKRPGPRVGTFPAGPREAPLAHGLCLGGNQRCTRREPATLQPPGAVESSPICGSAKKGREGALCSGPHSWQREPDSRPIRRLRPLRASSADKLLTARRRQRGRGEKGLAHPSTRHLADTPGATWLTRAPLRAPRPSRPTPRPFHVARASSQRGGSAPRGPGGPRGQAASRSDPASKAPNF